VPTEYLRNTNYIGSYTKYYFWASSSSVWSAVLVIYFFWKKLQASYNTKMESAQIKYNEIIFFISVVSVKQLIVSISSRMVQVIRFKQEVPRNEKLMINKYSSCNLKSFTEKTFWVSGGFWQNTIYISSYTIYYLLTLVYSFCSFYLIVLVICFF